MNDDEQPLVSVILPTYNRANLIGRAIKSALTQTYQNFEIIVVDDCSTDNMDGALAEFNDPRIKFIRNKENKGGSGARNVGIEASRADYVAFLDDDDEWLPTKLEKQMQVFYKGNDKLGAVSCAAVKYRDGKKYFEKWPERKGDVYEYLVNTLRSYGTPMTIVKRKYLDQSGFFDESLPSHQELDLFIRLARCCEFDFVNEILVHIHSYPDGIIGNIHNAIRGRINVVCK